MERTDPAPPTPAGNPETRIKRWPLRRPELVLIVVCWSFLALLTVAEELLDPRGSGELPSFSWEPVSEAGFEYFLWAALTPLIFWLSTRFSSERRHLLWRVLLLIGVGVVVAVFVDEAVDRFRIHVLDMGRPRELVPSVMRSVTRLWFLSDFIVYLAVLAAGFAREYFLRYQARQAETVRLQAHAAQLQAQLAEARLEALRMQMNPHFLFNTLHAVSSLVERDPRGVRRMIARLSELLRTTLNGRGDHEVPLEQEIEFLQRYLEIMQVRFQGRLEVEMDIAPGTPEALVPNLILQPLVENAIKHGVSNNEGTGRIGVRAHRDGDQLVVSVRDNGPGVPADGRAGTEEGVGLRNTRARLLQLYGDNQGLTLRPAEEGGLVTEIRLPYHTGADLRAAVAPEPPAALAHGG